MLSRFLAFALVCLSAGLWAQAGRAQPVEYVKICSMWGIGYFYNPGTETCIRADNGDSRRVFDDRIERREVPLAARVTALESTFCDTCFAVLRPDGTLSRGFDTTSSTRTSRGHYQIVFERSLAQCAVNATLGNYAPGTPPAPGFITTSAKVGDTKALLVETRSLNGAYDDRSFHITFECTPRPPFVQITPR